MAEHIPIKIVSVDSPFNKAPLQADKLYVRSAKGPIERRRSLSYIVLFLLFALLPWLSVEGRQAILLDFSAQRFHVFQWTLWPQDLTLMAWVFIIAAFGLFFVTSIAGRVWCGFTCPQTAWTWLFNLIERVTEGDRNRRIARDKAPWHYQNLSRRLLKHVCWIGVSLFTALTFVGYFTPIDQLFSHVANGSTPFWPGFWIGLFALCTYLNAGWMKHLMCTHMCPYSRFQSAMFDKDTLTVTYDAGRGEGRGPRSKKMSSETRAAKGLGDCIDCQLCVQVCPTGIDIRNGLQYECINCGACVDACNNVMDKMGYSKGLIRFSSGSRLNGDRVNLWRPKVIGYAMVLLTMIGLFVADAMTRLPFEASVLRDRNQLSRYSVDGKVENIYTVKISNKSGTAQLFHVHIEGIEQATLSVANAITVQPDQTYLLPLSVSVPPNVLTDNITPITFVIDDIEQQDASATLRIPSKFIVF
ncbi:cytochrome c oxidase accessory protein CcoG [Aestuariibacter halophilus]|uniref:Cytochrome c oxidase accessory protein CcoG n=1 Tax=Fluctibacter halophilus TaxID=226011 RepID=A0ABS8G4J4_9ALTE|nr:cytochrome c oxidase accessory protein CcoG [Aestuariibacter halophilus]MCC2615036.1 cytochrome c oxidase accessory protein CcoG [Aestuariibacter halophilus]